MAGVGGRWKRRMRRGWREEGRIEKTSVWRRKVKWLMTIKREGLHCKSG